jgi:hypothetical protein
LKENNDRVLNLTDEQAKKILNKLLIAIIEANHSQDGYHKEYGSDFCNVAVTMLK